MDNVNGLTYSMDNVNELNDERGRVKLRNRTGQRVTEPKKKIVMLSNYLISGA